MSTEHISISSPTLSVHITLTDTLVTALTFEGPQAQDPTLEKYIQHCIGYSLRECAEHSAMYVVDDLHKGHKRQPHQGIDCVQMLGSGLTQAQSLLREALQQQSTQIKEWNFEDRGLSLHWKKKSKAEQKDILNNIAHAYLEKRGYTQADLSLVQIDLYGRLFYEFSAAVPVGAKPGLLLGLEHEFQKILHERLEVFLTEMKDQHKLRRL